MGKKINTNDFVNQNFKNKKNERYFVTKYLFKEKTNYCFEIKFYETNNTQMATLNQIRNGTCKDIIQAKKIKRLKTELELRERNRLVKKAKKICIIPTDLNKKKVLAVDLATRSTGIAYAVNGKIVRWKTILAENGSFRERGTLITSELINIINKVDVVILEDIYLGLNSSILSMLAEVRGMLTYHLVKNKIELLLIPPVLWKNRFQNMPTSRNEQKHFVKTKFFEFTGEEAETDDVADAYMMLKACLLS